MSPEGKPGSHIILGQGVENLTSHPRLSPDYVIKLAHDLYFFKRYKLDEKGIKTKERVKKNLQIVHKYFDDDLLPETKTRSFKGVWITQQKFLPVENFVNYKNIIDNPQLIPKIERVLNQIEIMHKETGYCLDLFGFNKISEITKTLLLPNYWSIPNIVITKENDLKIFDLGLYLDKNSISNVIKIEDREIEKHPTFSKLTDPLVCELQLELMGKIREKMYCQMANII